MSRDFFDDDLLESGEQTPASKDEAVVEADVAEPSVVSEEEYGSPESADRLARHKEELSGQVAGAVSEIELLRRRQDALEKERAELEDLARRQEAYQRGKRDIIEKLDRSIVLLEKEELQAKQMIQLLGQIRGRFKESLAEVRQIKEETWPDASFQDELNKALVLVEEARSDYESGLAKIEASSWHRDLGGRKFAAPLQQIESRPRAEKRFGYWLKVGLAVSIPLMLMLGVLFAAVLIMALRGLI